MPNLFIIFKYFHIFVSVLSLGIFSVSFVAALLYLYAERKIKHKNRGVLLSYLPSLSVLEKIFNKALFFGFILLTLVILSGIGFEKLKNGHYFVLSEFKQTWSLFCWMLFFIFLNSKTKRGWQGYRGVLFSLFGFCFLAVLFFVGFK